MPIVEASSAESKFSRGRYVEISSPCFASETAFGRVSCNRMWPPGTGKCWQPPPSTVYTQMSTTQRSRTIPRTANSELRIRTNCSSWFRSADLPFFLVRSRCGNDRIRGGAYYVVVIKPRCPKRDTPRIEPAGALDLIIPAIAAFQILKHRRTPFSCLVAR
jgi:hypothetical protein